MTRVRVRRSCPDGCHLQSNMANGMMGLDSGFLRMMNGIKLPIMTPPDWACESIGIIHVGPLIRRPTIRPSRTLAIIFEGGMAGRRRSVLSLRGGGMADIGYILRLPADGRQCLGMGGT